MNSDIHPSLAADRWGNVRALCSVLDAANELLAVSEQLRRKETAAWTFDLRMAIGKVGLVKPFDWMKWGEPALTKEAIPDLDDDTAWRHVTRIARADRFMEGVFDQSVASGIMTALLRHIYDLRQTENGVPGSLPMLAEGFVEPGIRTVGVNSRTMGYTTGRIGECPVDGCSVAVVEIDGMHKKSASQWMCLSQFHYVPQTHELFRIPMSSHRMIRDAAPTLRS